VEWTLDDVVIVVVIDIIIVIMIMRRYLRCSTMSASTRCSASVMSVFVEACRGRAEEIEELKAEERKR